MNLQVSKIALPLFLVLVLMTACGSFAGEGRLPGEEISETGVPDVTESIQPTILPSQTPRPSQTPKPSLTPTPTITPTVVLPPQPQQISFQAEDGQELLGTYYPASQNPAPVLVLMHWARADQESWAPIAAWLQNRGLETGAGGQQPWLRPGWFPDRTGESEIGVFTFTFRNCQGGCRGYPAGGWLLDAQAAVLQASQLPGVNPDHILTAGASTGADGAVDACRWLNEQGSGPRCRGAFAFSPASFLTVPYRDAAVEILNEDPPGTVYCLYDRRDDAAMETCQQVEEAVVVDYGYVHKHGMELIDPNLDPPALELLGDFIEGSYRESRPGQENQEGES